MSIPENKILSFETSLLEIKSNQQVQTTLPVSFSLDFLFFIPDEKSLQCSAVYS